MKVLENHFEGKDTILIHNRIINGCKDFTLDEAAPILEKFKVPVAVWQQVLDAYTGVSTDEEITNHLSNDGDSVREAIAKHGNKQHRDALLQDESWLVRCVVARYGDDEQRGFLINDKQPDVRRHVAVFGNDAHRDVLVNDTNSVVRRFVAKYGNKSHRGILLDDDDLMVRAIVATLGNEEQLNTIIANISVVRNDI